jgi:sorbitol-6-phosphate 2-dehydrogenase
MCGSRRASLKAKQKEETMSRTLRDQVAIVTGAAQGLGAAIARRLADEGAHVVVADLNLEGAQQVAEAISQKGDRQALGVQVDVTDEPKVEAMVQQAVDRFGRLDILVANAGIIFAGAISEFPLDKWRQVIEVNLVGYFLCAKHAAKVMKEQDSGVIIQINSRSGKQGDYKNSAYASSKFAGIGLTQSLARELAGHGIRVNAVCPGNLLDSPLWVDTLYDVNARKWGVPKEEVRSMYEAKVPLGRGCTYGDVTNVLVFLASDASSYMTGQAVNVTGGEMM